MVVKFVPPVNCRGTVFQLSVFIVDTVVPPAKLGRFLVLIELKLSFVLARGLRNF